MACKFYNCPNYDPYTGYCKITACTRKNYSYNYLYSGNIQVNEVGTYKDKLKKNLKDLFMQPGIITEHAVFDVIDRTN